MHEITRCAIELYRTILADRALYFKHINTDLFTDISALREALTSVLLSDNIEISYHPLRTHLDNHRSSIWYKCQILLKYTQEEDEFLMNDAISGILLAFREIQSDG